MEEEFLQSDDKLKHEAWTWYDNKQGASGDRRELGRCVHVYISQIHPSIIPQILNVFFFPFELKFSVMYKIWSPSIYDGIMYYFTSFDNQYWHLSWKSQPLCHFTVTFSSTDNFCATFKFAIFMLQAASERIQILLRGYYTPNLKLACFVCYLKIIHTFFFFLAS